MPTVSQDLDTIQTFLHDQGAIWSRAELLDWYNDGYRILVSQSAAVRVLVALDLPPRVSMAITHDWEADYVKGTVRKFTHTHRDGTRQCTHLWEAEVDGGLAGSEEGGAVTQLWELGHAQNTVDTRYRVILPAHHQQLLAVWHDHEPLDATLVKELDPFETEWWTVQGEPYKFVMGSGDFDSFEVYQIETTNTAVYAPVNWQQGMPSAWSSPSRTYATAALGEWRYSYTSNNERTWAAGTSVLPGLGYRWTGDAGMGVSPRFYTQPWEAEILAGQTDNFTPGRRVCTHAWERGYGAESITLSPGAIADIVSPDRQYWPVTSWDTLGIMRSVTSSADNLLIHQVLIPERALAESETPTMLPSQAQKYLRYFVWWRCFEREGEGYDPHLAQHWQQRFSRGIVFMRQLGRVLRLDEHFAREPASPFRRRVPRPQLPSEFPRVPWLG